MRIVSLEVHNFRGIKYSKIEFPEESRIVCLIGAGDSTKSTILTSINWLLFPAWNLISNDNDFYSGDTTKTILVRGTFTEIPEALLSEDKYGFYLRNGDVDVNPNLNDEPIDQNEPCITIELTIDGSLEPKWNVICNRKEPKEISYKDRKLMQSGFVGENCEKDMSWGRDSILQKYADSKSTLHQAYTEVIRNAVNNANLEQLDTVSEKIVEVGMEYGVSFNSEITNKIIMQNSSFSSSVGLFDGNTPLSQRGKGSRRLLSIGLNIQSYSGKSMLIIDEIEDGLEPYRLKSLIEELRETHKEYGQVIFTTHSPVAVTECNIKDLLIITSKDGTTYSNSLYTGDAKIDNVFQREIRRNPEAFLSKRIIVCEGKTEIGFVRALNKYRYNKQKIRFAFKGIGIADGGGDNMFACVETLHKCGYSVCLVMDSDKPEEETQKQDLRQKGVSIFDWASLNSIEEQIFYDVSNEVANKLINLVAEEKTTDSVLDKLKKEGITCDIVDDTLILPEIDTDTRRKIGSIAKTKVAWFKRIDLGEKLGDIIFEHWDEIDVNCKLKETVEQLSEWVDNYD